MCVHRARQSSGCAWGPRPQRERLGTVKVLTHREKIEKEGQRGRENGSGRVGEWGDRERERGRESEREGERERERERTLPGVSFFLSAIINGILPLTHSSLRQTKDPTFQCSLTGQPASHPVEPHCSHPLKLKPHHRGRLMLCCGCLRMLASFFLFTSLNIQLYHNYVLSSCIAFGPNVLELS